jgi:glycosyltransferase involved in cell wall biosynthesis
MGLYPKVSVIMAVYNGEKYLSEAVESILGQTFGNFEFIIINDGSTDRSPNIIEGYWIRDKRIIVISQENTGLAAALNRGLVVAKGKYIARMDADDISLPQRFEKQIAFMEKHEEIGLCGTWIENFGANGSTSVRLPTDPEIIRCTLLFGFCIAHPSVMIRKDVLDAHSLAYNSEYRYGQDYDFWERFSRCSKLANIPEVLLRHRHHLERATTLNWVEQAQAGIDIRRRQIEALGLNPSHDDIVLHQRLGMRGHEVSREYVSRVERWLLILKNANRAARAYSEKAFSRVLAGYWFSVCKANQCLGPWIWLKLAASPLTRCMPDDWSHRMWFSFYYKKGQG